MFKKNSKSRLLPIQGVQNSGDEGLCHFLLIQFQTRPFPREQVCAGPVSYQREQPGRKATNNRTLRESGLSAWKAVLILTMNTLLSPSSNLKIKTGGVNNIFVFLQVLCGLGFFFFGYCFILTVCQELVML